MIINSNSPVSTGKSSGEMFLLQNKAVLGILSALGGKPGKSLVKTFIFSKKHLTFQKLKENCVGRPQILCKNAENPEKCKDCPNILYYIYELKRDNYQNNKIKEHLSNSGSLISNNRVVEVLGGSNGI